MILVLDDYPLSRQGLESVIRMYRPEEQDSSPWRDSG